MDDLLEISSDISLNESEDDDFELLNFADSHNNNGSFCEHNVLSSQQVYSMMANEIRKVRDVVTHVSIA
jgi:hypothetical protein